MSDGGLRHAVKALIFAVLPSDLREAIDRRYYFERFRRGELSNEEEFTLLPALVSDGMTALDIGANLGGYAIRMSELVGGAGQVHAFEPVPRTARLLRYNLERLTSHPNVVVHEAAVSEASGTAVLHLPLEGPLENFYTASLRRRAGMRARPVTVRTLALDDWVATDHGRIGFMKIDTEGAEWNVIQGARRVLRDHQPIVLCEIGDGVRMFGHEQRDVFASMGELGYQGFRYLDGALVEATGPDGRRRPNYLFVPVDRPLEVRARS
jgi:FkbM family methyltransferase